MNKITDIDITGIESVMNPAFHWLLGEEYEVNVLRGGTGSGKSISILQTLIYFIFTFPTDNLTPLIKINFTSLIIK